MVEGVEGLGEAVTGGIAARAVEPEAGEAASPRHERCLNCGTTLVGDFCHSCGQKGHVHRTITAWWHDLAHGVLHLDGKIWRTLPLLAWWPGELTRRYVEGERAKFVSPMAIFLFSVFLMFAVFSTVGGPTTSSTSAQGPSVADGSQEAADEMRAELSGLQKQREEAVREGRPTSKIDAEIRQTSDAIKVAEGLAAVAGGRKIETTGADGAPSEDLGGDLPDWINSPIGKVRSNPELVAYKLQNNAYKFSWALIPISVPFVWLLFMFRRRYRMYDHTVFVTYSLAFMTLLTVVASLLRAIGFHEAVGILALIFIPPIHMYRQLKGAYRLSRFSALWRAMVLAVFATIAASLFFAMLLTIGVLG